MAFQRRIAQRLGLSLLAVLATAAGPPPENPTPRECLDAYESMDVDYVGDGWPDALVAGPPGTWLSGLFDDADRDFSLYCGNELSGVVHISGDRTSGTGHPITTTDENFLVWCWMRTISAGTPTDQGDGRTRFVLRESSTTTSAYVDNSRRFTYSLYTSSGDWHDCAFDLA